MPILRQRSSISREEDNETKQQEQLPSSTALFSYQHNYIMTSPAAMKDAPTGVGAVGKVTGHHCHSKPAKHDAHHAVSPRRNHFVLSLLYIPFLLVLATMAFPYLRNRSSHGNQINLVDLFQSNDPVALSQELAQIQQQQRALLKHQEFSSTSAACSTATAPVIGVMALPYYAKEDPSSLYVAASYVKWLESAGARTVVIPYWDDDEPTPEQKAILDDVFSQIHMIFLTGGTAPYPKATLNYLLDKVVALNRQDENSFFPVWGTCLGFEFLIEYVARRGGDSKNHDHNDDILEDGFVAHNVSWPLEDVVVQDLYWNPVLLHAVQYYNVTLNNHEFGISPGKFMSNAKLQETFVITSTNRDENGRPFVSTIEPRKTKSVNVEGSESESYIPFYGVQYHPEKNTFEYGVYPDMPNVPYEAIDHSPMGVAFSFHMAQFIVNNLARRSQMANPDHCYTKLDVHPPIYTYPVEVGIKFEQRYLIQTTYDNHEPYTNIVVIPSANNNSHKNNSDTVKTIPRGNHGHVPPRYQYQTPQPKTQSQQDTLPKQIQMPAQMQPDMS